MGGAWRGAASAGSLLRRCGPTARRNASVARRPKPRSSRDASQEAWKNWINYASPFKGSSDELNRERKFFWEVDDKVRSSLKLHICVSCRHSRAPREHEIKSYNLYKTCILYYMI